MTAAGAGYLMINSSSLEKSINLLFYVQENWYGIKYIVPKKTVGYLNFFDNNGVLYIETNTGSSPSEAISRANEHVGKIIPILYCFVFDEQKKSVQFLTLYDNDIQVTTPFFLIDETLSQSNKNLYDLLKNGGGSVDWIGAVLVGLRGDRPADRPVGFKVGSCGAPDVVLRALAPSSDARAPAIELDGSFTHVSAFGGAIVGSKASVNRISVDEQLATYTYKSGATVLFG